MSERHQQEEQDEKESAFISLYKKQFGNIRRQDRN